MPTGNDPLSPIQPGMVVAQCWYRAEDYAEIKAMMADGHLLPRLHSQWLEGAEQREEQIRRKGGLPVRVPFDPAEFRGFCLRFSIAIDSEARTKFAALKALDKK